MTGINRTLGTLLAMVAAGCLLWAAAQVGRGSNGDYWGAYGIVAAAGVVVAVSQFRGGDRRSLATLALAFVPVLLIAVWVLAALEPQGSWLRNHVLAWSSDLGISTAVRDVGTWAGVLAFGTGFVLALALEPAGRFGPARHASRRRRALVEQYSLRSPARAPEETDADWYGRDDAVTVEHRAKDERDAWR
jgi:hypothetical protein